MYVPPDAQKMQMAFQAGKASFNPVPGAMNLIFTDYAQAGDRMTLTFDTAAKKITSLSVNTYMGQAERCCDIAGTDGQSAGWHELRAANDSKRDREKAGGYDRQC